MHTSFSWQDDIARQPSRYFWRYYAEFFYETSHTLRIGSDKIDRAVDANYIFMQAKFDFFAGGPPFSNA
jgi:hypothetical protein